jgi:hypothetical protein
VTFVFFLGFYAYFGLGYAFVVHDYVSVACAVVIGFDDEIFLFLIWILIFC